VYAAWPRELVTPEQAAWLADPLGNDQDWALVYALRLFS
jgi:hypothetical protein